MTLHAIAELNRRLDNLLRIGTVTEVAGGLCRVQTGELLTDWRPYFTHRAGASRTSWKPSKDEQVMLLSPGGDIASAYVLPALNSEAFDVPSDHPDNHYTVYPDGAVIEYNPDTSALTVTGIKKAEISASEQVTVTCPNSKFIGNLEVTKKLKVSEGAEITGAIDHNGKLTNQGGVNIDGIEFGTHKHPAGTPFTGSPV